MSIWKWYYGHRRETLNDSGCTELHREMFRTFDLKGENVCDYDLGMMRRAGEIAKQLNDDLMHVWCEAWCSMTLSLRGHLEDSVEILLRLALRVRDEKFNGIPHQTMVSVLFVGKMAEIDPAGNGEQIAEAAKYIESICEPYSEHLIVLNGYLANRQMSLRQPELALPYLQKHFDLLPHNPGRDYYSALRLRMMFFHFLKQEWNELLANADEVLGQPSNSDQEIGEAHLGRACALLHLDFHEDARRDFERGRAFFSSHPISKFFRYTSYFLEHTDQLEKAIQVRLDQQERGAGMGRHWEMACGAKHLIELYQRNNQPTEANTWVDRLNELTSQLKKPEALDTIQF